jgi:hypothetical protein
MAEKSTRLGTVAEIEQDAFLLAELNFRAAYTVDPVSALEQWFELVAEFRLRDVTNSEISELSWRADDRANIFDLDKELTCVE